mmetsp:Transcript_12243/g.39391  ORF Transcript_12243/g.39391 Transcript_12243/m.39391 type:complete len:423 (+) Transcript_12243:1555-2823(+)
MQREVGHVLGDVRGGAARVARGKQPGALARDGPELAQRACQVGRELAQVVHAELSLEQVAVKGRREGEIDQTRVEHRLGNETAHEGEELQRALGHARPVGRLRHRSRKEAAWRMDQLFTRALRIGAAGFRLDVDGRLLRHFLVMPEVELRLAQLVRYERVELERRAEAGAYLAKILDLEQRLLRGVEIHHLDGRVDHPRPGDAHLLPRQPAETRLGARLTGAICPAGAPLARVRLHAQQCAREAKRSGVKVETARLKGEEKVARRGERVAPAWERARAERQRVLQLPHQLGVELRIEKDRRRQRRSARVRCLSELGGREDAAPVFIEPVEKPEQLQHRRSRLASVGGHRRRSNAQRPIERIGVDRQYSRVAPRLRLRRASVNEDRRVGAGVSGRANERQVSRRRQTVLERVHRAPHALRERC